MKRYYINQIKQHLYSFVNKEKTNAWSDKNKLKPWKVTIGTHEKYYFDCQKCKHTFLIALHTIVNRLDWCPYCSNLKLCQKNNCYICYNKSFASVKKSKYITDDANPIGLFKTGATKLNFKCEKGHIFNLKVRRVSNGIWCPECFPIHKTEKVLSDWLCGEYHKSEREKTFTWTINNETGSYFKFDFYLCDFNLIIEIDGRQHIEQVSNWESFENIQKRDIIKMKLALNNGISVIRIYQDDIYKNTIDWKKLLRENIKKYDIPVVIYIAKNNNIYDAHKKKMTEN